MTEHDTAGRPITNGCYIDDIEATAPKTPKQLSDLTVEEFRMLLIDALCEADKRIKRTNKIVFSAAQVGQPATAVTNHPPATLADAPLSPS